jgi:hypothetical protein
VVGDPGLPARTTSDGATVTATVDLRGHAPAEARAARARNHVGAALQAPT